MKRFLFTALCFLALSAHADPVTVTGRIIRFYAIGGETTGWGISMGVPLNVGGTDLYQIEVDPVGLPIRRFIGQRVQITGNVEIRSGVEREDYPVLVVQTMYKLYRTEPLPRSRAAP